MKALNLVGFIGSVTLAIASGHLLAADAPAKVDNGIFVNAKGMTLYTFDKDGGGKSVCNNQCAAIWPPLLMPAGAAVSGDFSIITRDDGSQQIAHQGHPLYLYAADQKPGDMTGDNSGGVWHVLRAAKSGTAGPAKSTSSNPFSYSY